MQLFLRQFSSSNKTIKPITQQNHTANHTAETQRHVVDACIRSLPLTTTHEDHLGGGAYCYSGESLRRLNRINRRGDENKEIVPKKGYTTSVFFGNGSATWSQTKHCRLALGAKSVGDQCSAELQTPPSFSTISKGSTPQSTQKA